MASVTTQQTTRTRSSRVTISKTSSSTSTTASTRSSRAQTPAQPHHAEATSKAEAAALAASPSSGAGPSSLALFLTNIKLLDLDLLPDWPSISGETFATSGASVQGLKKRVHCVEWVLFQLFSIWDPEETANKLKPFFPPIDQLQSVNLRTALVRALEQAKKNGILGRDTIIRKTMLDDCKGERLEEVLAYFSTAVLKKVVANDITTSSAHMTPVVRLALENRSYKGDQAELIALTLAHRNSLKRVLERKKTARALYRDFSELLGVKEEDVARRRDVVLAKLIHGHGHPISHNTRAEWLQTVRGNWSGNEAWMETLLHGDANDGGFMNMPYDNVWRRVRHGRLGELEAGGGGLLQQLETRVRVQKERLQKWDSFRKNMFGDSKASPSKSRSTPAKAKGINFNFGAHQDLHLGRSKHTLAIRNQEAEMTDDYVDLVSELKDELAKIRRKDVNLASLFSQRAPMKQVRRIISTSSTEARDEISDLEDEEDEEDVFSSKVPISSFQDKLMGSRPTIRPRLSRPNLSQSQTISNPAAEQRNFPGRSQYDLAQLDDFDSPPSVTASRQPDPFFSDAPMQRSPPQMDAKPPTRAAPEPQPREVVSPTQGFADQILESMDSTSPSPVKRTKPRHTLSLAERTSLSLTRKKSMAFEDQEPDLPVVPVAEESHRQATNPDHSEDLVSRTRKSMAGFEKAQQKAQLERRRSQRRSKVPPPRAGGYFSKVDEDTEQANRLAEQLANEEDMEAVFRSRPKIKQSMHPSPTKDWTS